MAPSPFPWPAWALMNEVRLRPRSVSLLTAPLHTSLMNRVMLPDVPNLRGMPVVPSDPLKHTIIMLSHSLMQIITLGLLRLASGSSSSVPELYVYPIPGLHGRSCCSLSPAQACVALLPFLGSLGCACPAPGPVSLTSCSHLPG